MNYLGRLASRSVAAPAPGRSDVLPSTLRSQSPITEVDQRVGVLETEFEPAVRPGGSVPFHATPGEEPPAAASAFARNAAEPAAAPSVKAEAISPEGANQVLPIEKDPEVSSLQSPIGRPPATGEAAIRPEGSHPVPAEGVVGGTPVSNSERSSRLPESDLQPFPTGEIASPPRAVESKAASVNPEPPAMSPPTLGVAASELSPREPPGDWKPEPKEIPVGGRAVEENSVPLVSGDARHDSCPSKPPEAHKPVAFPFTPPETRLPLPAQEAVHAAPKVVIDQLIVEMVPPKDNTPALKKQKADSQTPQQPKGPVSLIGPLGSSVSQQVRFGLRHS
jgi:hypothetical protein